MNKTYAILAITLIANINSADARCVGEIEIPEDVYNSNTFHGVNLDIAHGYLKNDREKGEGNSAFNTFSLLRSTKDKIEAENNHNTRSILKDIKKKQENEVVELFGLTKYQVDAIPGQKEEEEWRKIAKNSPVLLTIVTEGKLPADLREGKGYKRKKGYLRIKRRSFNGDHYRVPSFEPISENPKSKAPFTLYQKRDVFQGLGQDAIKKWNVSAIRKQN